MMVDWNEVIPAYLWLSGLLVNAVIFVSMIGFAIYGIYVSLVRYGFV